MKPVAFEYCRPDTIEEALELLDEFGGDGVPISGGLSLGAMLNMRLVRPVALIDINGLADLSGIEISGETFWTGAMVRQAMALKCENLISQVPLLGKALPYVGHYQTRSRGTLGGSVAHADPSAEIPLILVTLGGSVALRSSSAQREVLAGDFFHGLLTTDRQDDELITGIIWPKRRNNTGYAFEEIAQRHGDFAIAAVAVEITISDDSTIARLSLGLGGVEDRPFLANTETFIGRTANAETASEVANTVAEAIDPMVDLQANANYRRQLVRVLGKRTLTRAIDQVIGKDRMHDA